MPIALEHYYVLCEKAEDMILPSIKPRLPMPCAFEMLIIVWWAAADSIWPMLSALRHAEAAKLRAAVFNIVAV